MKSNAFIYLKPEKGTPFGRSRLEQPPPPRPTLVPRALFPGFGGGAGKSPGIGRSIRHFDWLIDLGNLCKKAREKRPGDEVAPPRHPRWKGDKTAAYGLVDLQRLQDQMNILPHYYVILFPVEVHLLKGGCWRYYNLT